jgi:hypothetical protein
MAHKTANTDTITRRPAAEIRQDLLALAERTDAAIARGDARSEDDRDALRRDLLDLQALDTLFLVTQRAEYDETLGEPGDGPRGALLGESRAGSYSPGEDFTRSDGYVEFRKSSGGHYEYEVRTLMTNTGSYIAAPSASGAGLLAPLGTPYIPPVTQIRPMQFMRDILPSTSTSLSIVPYIQEQSYLSNVAGAGWVLEAGQKPELAMNWVPARATIEKIAGWIPATYELLADVPLMRGLIDNFLQNSVSFREDRGLLSGSGTDPEIRGLLNTTGLQTQAFTSDALTSLGLAQGVLENIEGQADFQVMNTLDFWQIQTTRNATRFDGEALTNAAPFGVPPAGLWGVNVKRTNAMARGSALVGDSRGAMILDREGVVIRIGDQHLDYFTTNKIAILAEKRVGLMVFRPDFFVSVALS